MRYQQPTPENGSSEAPAQANEQASAASVGHWGTEQGIFGDTHSHSLSDAAAEVPHALVGVPAAMASVPAFFASALRETSNNQPHMASVPENGHPGGQLDQAADSRPGLSSTCTLSSGFVTQVMIASRLVKYGCESILRLIRSHTASGLWGCSPLYTRMRGYLPLYKMGDSSSLIPSLGMGLDAPVLLVKPDLRTSACRKQAQMD